MEQRQTHLVFSTWCRAVWLLFTLHGDGFAQIWTKSPTTPFIVSPFSRVQFTWLYDAQGKEVLFQKFGASAGGFKITDVYVRVDSSGATVLRPEIVDFQPPGTLVLKNVTTSDNLKVIASEIEILEQAASLFKSVVIQFPAQIPTFLTSLPPTSTYKEGNVNVGFKVQVSSSPLPQVVWLLNGAIIPNNAEYRVDESTVAVNNITAKQSILRIAKVRISHAGNLTARATFQDGGTSYDTTTQLTVNLSIPLFRQQLASKSEFQILDQGKKFQVKVAGDWPPNVIWLLNGVALSPGNGLYIENENVTFNNEIVLQSTLTISEIRVEHAGELKARAFFYLGGLLSESATQLIVYYGPRQLRFTSSSARVIRGDQLILSCTAQGYPPPIYNVTEDYQTISDSPNGLVVVKPEGTASYVRYRCSARNDLGLIESTYVEVEIVNGMSYDALWPQMKDSHWWIYYLAGVAVLTFAFFGCATIAYILRSRSRKVRLQQDQAIQMKQRGEKEAQGDLTRKAENGWTKARYFPTSDLKTLGNYYRGAPDGGQMNYGYDKSYKNGDLDLDY